MSERINVILPEETVRVLDRVTTQSKNNPAERLKAGYRRTAAKLSCRSESDSFR